MTGTSWRLRAAALLAAGLLLVAPLGIPGATVADKPSSKGNVDKRPPQAQDPDMSSEDDDSNAAGVQVTPNSDSNRTVTAKVDVDDGNGHNDVDSVKVTVYKPDNATVHVSESSASKDSGSGKTAKYSHDFDMDYWHDSGTYHVKAVSTDRDGDTATTWNTFEYQNLTSLSMNTTTASFDDGDGDGKLDPGGDTHDSPVNISIENTGNVELDVSFNGTDVAAGGSNVINVTQLHLDADQDGNFSTNEWNFKYSKQTVTSFDLSASTDGTATSKFVNMAIHVPEVPSGTYTGTMTLEAVKST